MTTLVVRRFRFAALLAALGLAAGCVFTVPTDPNLYPVAAGDFPALPAGTKVELVNDYSKSYLARMEANQQADLHEFTQTAVVVLGRALEAKGAVLAPGGKQVVLEATGPNFAQGFGTVRCSVTLNAKFGSAKASTFGEAGGLNATKNFSSAITKAVEELLRKPEFRDYLARP